MNIFFGTKSTMTQAWSKSGKRMPITVVKVPPMTVAQIKNLDTDGYLALQVTLESQKHREIRLEEVASNAVGDTITIDQVCNLGDMVQVTGSSKGKGFSGPMKRWGFKGGPKTHGQSDRARAPGSIGQGTTPGRVLKGRKMAGQYGGETYTVKNLQVVNILPATNEIWIKGAIPGSRTSLVQIKVVKPGKFDGLINQTSSTETESTTK